VLTDLLEVLDQGINGVIGSNYISTTKIIGIDALISSSGLEAGTLYKISGVHPTLYDDGNIRNYNISKCTNNK
jgi:Ca2+/Na+ antiporter